MPEGPSADPMPLDGKQGRVRQSFPGQEGPFLAGGAETVLFQEPTDVTGLGPEAGIVGGDAEPAARLACL